jgi:hypothetical protein
MNEINIAILLVSILLVSILSSILLTTNYMKCETYEINNKVYNDKRDNKINYPLWMRNKYGHCTATGCNDGGIVVPSNNIKLASTDSNQNVSTEYLNDPTNFCADIKNAWKKPCPNYWLFPEI